MSLIAIDGRAGAGKTTLAASFYEELSADKTVAVIHMDDLYDGWENALSEHLTQTLESIVKSHQSKVAFEIDIFNWKSMSFDSKRVIHPVDILILEGVGAGQKVVRDAAATLYWLDIDAEVGIQRVLNRDGNQIASQMKQWQIAQEIHFLRDKTRENAEHIQSSPA
ncbi:Udk Uridine kinase [Candidatus Planktophila vernalis]|uniref:uridine kinase family protein n=1 Tax=Candidatus Planktophila vernalis TaxID=1884907 RepID=UPI003CF7206D